MKKQKLIMVAAIMAMGISACTSKQETVSTPTTQATTEAETKAPEIALSDIFNWIIGDVWNDGFCNFYHYELDGKSSTGESIDIDFALERFKKNYEKREEYDSYINSLPAEYDSIKESWNMMMEESDKLYEHYKDGIEQSGIAADTALFVQYREAFTEDIRNMEYVSSKDSEEKSETGDAVEVDKGLFNVVIDVPKDFVGDTTQEELDKKAKKYGYKVKLNDDGSATYTMTKSQHREMMEELTINLNQSLTEMIGSENYPNFTDIKANSNFTEFTITTKSKELDLAESFSVIGFYMYGGMYNTFNGTSIDNIHVDFINADTGEILSSSDSKDMKE